MKRDFTLKPRTVEIPVGVIGWILSQVFFLGFVLFCYWLLTKLGE